jgi:hypothetical protein
VKLLKEQAGVYHKNYWLNRQSDHMPQYPTPGWKLSQPSNVHIVDVSGHSEFLRLKLERPKLPGESACFELSKAATSYQTPPGQALPCGKAFERSAANRAKPATPQGSH